MKRYDSLFFVFLLLLTGLNQTSCTKNFGLPSQPVVSGPPDVTSALPLTYISQWGSAGTGDGQFQATVGIAADSQGNLYVVDNNNHRIQKFDSAGNYLAQWGSLGVGNGQFIDPVGICVDSGDNIYVCDQGAGRIQKFSTSGTLLTQWHDGVGNSSWYCRGISSDPSNDIYVVDAVNQNIEKFDNSGTLITSWSTNGSWDATTSDPDGIVCDRWGNVYTPDFYNSCVYKYTNTGTFERQIGSPGSGPGQFGTLSCGICVDAKGIPYVSDYSYRRVSEFNLDGTYLCQWGNSGPGALGNFDYFCLSPSGKAYVEDNNTIKVFGPQ